MSISTQRANIQSRYIVYKPLVPKKDPVARRRASSCGCVESEPHRASMESCLPTVVQREHTHHCSPHRSSTHWKTRVVAPDAESIEYAREQGLHEVETSGSRHVHRARCPACTTTTQNQTRPAISHKNMSRTCGLKLTLSGADASTTVLRS